MLSLTSIRTITSINNSYFTLVWTHFQAHSMDWFICFHKHRPNIYLMFRVSEETVFCGKYINGQKASGIEVRMSEDEFEVYQQIFSLVKFGLAGLEATTW